LNHCARNEHLKLTWTTAPPACTSKLYCQRFGDPQCLHRQGDMTIWPRLNLVVYKGQQDDVYLRLIICTESPPGNKVHFSTEAQWRPEILRELSNIYYV